MKVRPAEADDDGGLDSLMDTMTNVVGILVLVLVMTQLDVQEALKQITQNSKVTAADLENAKSRLKDLEQQKKSMEQEASSIDIAAEQERLKRMLETVAAKKKLLQDQQQQQNQFAMSLENDKKMAAQKEKEIQLNEEERKTLEAKLTEALKSKANLEAKLDKTPQPPAPPAKLVSIPNPRPAPTGAKQLSFLCANNRLYPMNLDEFRKDAETRAKEIIVRHKLNLDPAAGIDPEKFEKFYTKLTSPLDDYLSVEYFVADKKSPRIRLLPKENRGFTDEELLRPRGRIRKILADIDPTKFYAYFYVLPDSYDVYITTRQILMESGVQAGWEPQPQTWVYTSWIPGGIALGPPPPPAPAPTTPAAPAAPPKPANVID